MSDNVDVRQLLVAHIRTLRSQHKAGINPTYGQVEDLFDYAERLDMEIRLSEPTMPCSLPGGCSAPATERIGKAAYCGKHAQALRAVTALVQSDAENIALARVADMERGRAAWPSVVFEMPADRGELDPVARAVFNVNA